MIERLLSEYDLRGAEAGADVVVVVVAAAAHDDGPLWPAENPLGTPADSWVKEFDSSW